MPLLNVDSTEVKLIEDNPRRKWVSFTIKTDAKDVFIGDRPKDPKWVLQKGDMLIIDRRFGFPERAFYATSDGSTQVMVGFQNDDEEPKP